jgi:hypothetical protein
MLQTIITAKKREEVPRACTLKHYRYVMYRFRSKLVCLSKPLKVAGNNEKTQFTMYPIGYLLIWQPSNQQGGLTQNLPTPFPL